MIPGSPEPHAASSKETHCLDALDAGNTTQTD